MNNQQTNIPKLRFPEFSGEWEKKKLGEIAEKIGDGLHGTPTYSSNSDIYFINGNNLTNGKIELNENTKKVDIETFASNDKKLNKNTLLISINGSIGNIAKYNNEKVMLGKSVAYFNFNHNADFYFHVLNTETIQNFFISELTGSTIKNLSLKTLRETEISIPTLPEQTNIASFCTAVDSKLQALKKKKSLLEAYKKGVMQKLFSQELRFKDENGMEFPEWEERKLGNIAEKRIVKNKDNKINHVFTNSALQGIVNQRDYFDKDIANQNNLTGYYLVEKNDFVYNPRISSFAPVGPISRNHLGTGVMSPLYSVFRFKLGNLNFLEYFFSSAVWHKHMEDISNYGARDDRMSFLSADFYEMPIYFPSIEEQTRIANFLSSIDEKLQAAQVQIDKMEAWKRGLLQKMFV